jgi:hypothetical protein
MSNSLLLSSKDFFSSIVREGFKNRNLQVHGTVEKYIVQLLEFYLDSRNLHEPEFSESGERQPQTLAEMFLTAQSKKNVDKINLLKKLGDKSLYISGFFGDSLQRKIIDVDYYISMGEVAYAQLADHTREEEFNLVYSTIANRFVDFVDVLMFVSHSSIPTTDKNVLRLYEVYLRTGSEVAKTKLVELGVFEALAQGPKTTIKVS